MGLLDIEKLHVTVDGKEILKGLDLSVPAGEVHAIMGPNGSGKSTLSYVLAGRDGYEVTDGKASFDGKDLLAMEPEERAREGLFLAFQYPVEIPGVGNGTFLRSAVNAVRKHRGEEELDAGAFLKVAKDAMKRLGMNKDFLSRAVNAGFSGGEKKRNEVFQMTMLEPRLAILDETDSGLDIDALKIVSKGVNKLRNETDFGALVITHYQRILDHIKPDYVHIMYQGRIVTSGGHELVEALEAKGYDWVKKQHGIQEEEANEQPTG